MYVPGACRIQIIKVSVVAFVVAAALSTLDGEAQTVSSLFRFVPEGANAALAIDVNTLKATSFARRQGWFERNREDGSPFYLPGEAEWILVASRVDPTGRLTAQWDVGLVQLAAPIDLPSMARAEGGYVDELAGRQAVWAPSGAYLIPLDSKTLGEYAPDDRQAASKWVTGVAPPARPPGGLTEYLKSSCQSVGAKTPVVMAFDLAEAFPPHIVHATVMDSQEFTADETRRKAIAGVLTSLRGVTILLEFDESARGTVRFDFATKVDPLRGLEKEILAATLNAAGVALPNVTGWQVHSAGKSVTARGDVTPGALRRLMSLIEMPTTKFSSLADAKPAPDEKAITAETSRQYYRTIVALLDDLREALGDTRGNEAVYLERYARKIDRLPILNVDDELLAWGGAVGETLRSGSLSVRGAGLRSGVRKSSLYGAYQYNYDGYGYYGGQPTESASAQINRQEGATARAEVYGSAKELADATSKVRVAMTKKYGIEF